METNLTALSVKKILIVEDDLIIALSTEKMVEKIGHDVIDRVTTGEQAIDVALKEKPDLILMDIRLAGKLDGIDATKKIKSEMDDIKIVYLTGNTDPAYRERANGTGYEAYLIKPITYKDLEKIIS
ncbi:MAG: response regulator [Balneolaceae bacterium]|nr:response regulator [Balneolaceae bacterium]MCH8547490.1 response regulator [Balneolaceae bacterium]